MLQGQVRDIAQGIDGRLKRFHGYETGLPFLDGFFDLEPGDRAGLGDVRTDQEQCIRGDDVFKGDGPAMGTLHASERLHSVEVAIPRAAVDPVGADHLAHELLEHIEVFVRATGADKPTERIRALRQLQAERLFGNIFQRVFPGGLDQLAFATDQRMCKAVGVAAGMEAEEAPGAEVAVIPSGSVCGVHLDQFIVLGLHGDPAAVAAEGADRVGPLEHPGAILIHGEPARDGADGADLDAASAEFAVQFMRAEVFDLGHGAAPHRSQRFHVHDLIAIPDAAQTLHTAVHLRFDEGAEVLFLEDAFGFRKPAGRRGVLMREILEVAFAALVADRAIQRMVGQDEFQDRLVGVVHRGGGGAHGHAFGDRRAAGGLELRHLLDFDQTHPAVGVRLQLGVVTKMRNHHPDAPRRFDHQGSLGNRDRRAVDSEPDCFWFWIRHSGRHS
jgi:hypothetical protein